MQERSVIQCIAGQRSVVATGPETMVRDAACIMTKANCGSILVIEHGTTAMLGIVTERDLMTRVIAKALDPARTPVADIMTRHPLHVPPEMPVSAAVVVMIERGFRHLPILAPNGRILGVFSIRDAWAREIDTAESLAEFHEQINDALG